MRRAVSKTICPILALLMLPQVAVAEDRSQLFSRQQGYLIQTGLSLAALPLTDDDKLQHVAVGSAISALVTYKTGRFWKGCGAALAVGLLKEIYDELSDTGRFEAIDAGYTLAGCSFTVRF
ncbi:hypothetical protein [Phaeobacter sp. B1627]|uniref:hypothetical protein n=1 Tax=Phaeobacter sp. B1627 TaxID=2583809 RepID=UPI001118C3F2|nr:hypothetical protein [Phaeobacter sp. B1627]TNJ40931.1 hypothetical protein FGE21_15620 [Phaeobacter sp. B1627]